MNLKKNIRVGFVPDALLAAQVVAIRLTMAFARSVGLDTLLGSRQKRRAPQLPMIKGGRLRARALLFLIPLFGIIEPTDGK